MTKTQQSKSDSTDSIKSLRIFWPKKKREIDISSQQQSSTYISEGKKLFESVLKMSYIVSCFCLLLLIIIYIIQGNKIISTEQSEVEKESMYFLRIYCHVYRKMCFFILFFPFIFIHWRLITLQYCSGFCHTLT